MKFTAIKVSECRSFSNFKQECYARVMDGCAATARIEGKAVVAVPGRDVDVRLVGGSPKGGLFDRTTALSNQRHGPGGKKHDTGDKHRNSANCEDITMMQIIALMLHYLAFDVRRRRRSR